MASTANSSASPSGGTGKEAMLHPVPSQCSIKGLVEKKPDEPTAHASRPERAAVSLSSDGSPKAGVDTRLHRGGHGAAWMARLRPGDDVLPYEGVTANTTKEAATETRTTGRRIMLGPFTSGRGPGPGSNATWRRPCGWPGPGRPGGPTAGTPACAAQRRTACTGPG